MSDRHLSLRNSMLVVFALMALVLTACGTETLVVGLEPTPTVTPTPLPVLLSYANEAYGFTFRYPETWTLAEAPHLITMKRDSLSLNIAYGWASDPGFSPMRGRTGMPAGDLVYGGKVFFLEQVMPTQVLEYESKDKMVFYGESDLVESGDLVFSLWLEEPESTDYSKVDIPKELQIEAMKILESFKRTEASGRPPVPTPTPTPIAEKDLSTYVNDDYRLTFIYPPSWTLEEVPSERVAGGLSANAVHLTRGGLRLAIQFKRLDEESELGPSGRPAGEIEERSTVTLLGRQVPKQVLMYQGKIKSVFLSVRVDDLEFYIQLDDRVGTEVDYEAIDIPETALVEMDAILSSLTRTGEKKAFGPDTLTYENRPYGFSFQYPVTWTVEEVAGETMEGGTRLADAVILRQGEFAIFVQYQHKSDPAQIAWGGDFVPGGLGYAEATLGDRVTLLGEETHKHVWTYDDGIKAIAVNTTGKTQDLILNITLADGSVRLIQDTEATTISQPAMAALDQILSSFVVTQ